MPQDRPASCSPPCKPIDGCLALAVQIYSDNSDEVTGATLKGGETGGIWTGAGELLGVTGVPDGGLAVFVAEMPVAGTISGGSVNANPTTPVNWVSLAFGAGLIHHPEIGTKLAPNSLVRGGMG